MTYIGFYMAKQSKLAQLLRPKTHTKYQKNADICSWVFNTTSVQLKTQSKNFASVLRKQNISEFLTEKLLIIILIVDKNSDLQFSAYLIIFAKQHSGEKISYFSKCHVYREMIWSEPHMKRAEQRLVLNKYSLVPLMNNFTCRLLEVPGERKFQSSAGCV